MKRGDHDQQPRRAQPLEPVQDVREARRRAEQHRADGADRAPWRSRARTSRAPPPRARRGPTSTAGPPRTNGTNAATKTTSGSDHPHARPDEPRADARDARRSPPARARRRRRPATRCSGVETATTVIPASPTIFARGSRRWIGLAGFAGDARAVQRARSCRRPPRRASTATSAVAEAEHEQRAGEAGEAGRDARVVDARERVVGHRRVLLHGVQPPWSRNALSPATLSSPSGDDGRERRHGGGEPDGDGEGEDREELHAGHRGGGAGVGAARARGSGRAAWRARR